MKKTNNNQELLELIQVYCKTHLDEEYKKLCTKAFRRLEKENPDVFNRGKQEVWAAAIVWAVGRANFLGDNTFEPYASLNDVCNYFGVNSSTVGQKASKIMEMLGMDYFNTEFLIDESEISKLVNSLVMTEDGLIVPKDMLIDEEEEDILPDEEEEDILLEDNGSPENYILILESSRKIKKSDIYQLEYLFKKCLRKGEKFIKAEITNNWTAIILFFGDLETVQNFEDKFGKTGFSLMDVQLVV